MTDTAVVPQHLDSRGIQIYAHFSVFPPAQLSGTVGAAVLQKDTLGFFGLDSINKILCKKQKSSYRDRLLLRCGETVALPA